ncbi:MAG: ribonuclease domain-containing protein [Solidesulfovibrio sp.]
MPLVLVFTAVTSALSGDMSGSAAQAMQSAVVTTIQGLGAQQVKKILSDLPQGDPTTETLRAGLQAIVGCAGAAASGGSCGAGALGASASVVLNNLADLATNTTGSKLTAKEKEARMNLLNSLVGGVTTALGGDAAAAVLAARVEQENNYAMLWEVARSGWLELPAIIQWLEANSPRLAQFLKMSSQIANDGSGAAGEGNPKVVFEEPSSGGQSGGSPGDPGKDPEKDKWANILDRIDKKGSPLPDYKGGKAWQNNGSGGAARLPEKDAAGNLITYKEWDVNKFIPGQNRGLERIVTGSDGSAYKTTDHYKTFTSMR